ncbi:hypothetical protein JW887_06350 [Candidatus Dojkabacteria bacterium]|nr:hypothetical protein [Candidatus Dojkabacteria bacterium]
MINNTFGETVRIAQTFAEFDHTISDQVSILKKDPNVKLILEKFGLELDQLDTFFVFGPAIKVLVWAYCRMNKDSIDSMANNGSLMPFSLIYKLSVEQDDVVDFARAKDYRSGYGDIDTTRYKCKDFFWDSNRFKAQYRLFLYLINKGSNPGSEEASKINRMVASGYRSFCNSDDKLFELAVYLAHHECPVDTDIVSIFENLRYESFGKFAEVFGHIATHCSLSEELKARLVALYQVTEIYDGLIDMEEDRGTCISLPMAAEIYDRQKGNSPGTTLSKKLSEYENIIDDPKVTETLRFLSRLYGIVYKIGHFSWLKKLFKGRFLMSTMDEPYS